MTDDVTGGSPYPAEEYEVNSMKIVPAIDVPLAYMYKHRVVTVPQKHKPGQNTFYPSHSRLFYRTFADPKSREPTLSIHHWMAQPNAMSCPITKYLYR